MPHRHRGNPNQCLHRRNPQRHCRQRRGGVCRFLRPTRDADILPPLQGSHPGNGPGQRSALCAQAGHLYCKNRGLIRKASRNTGWWPRTWRRSPGLGGARQQRSNSYGRYQAVDAMLLNEFLKEHRTVEQQNAEIQSLKQQNDSLAERLNGLEAAVRQLATRK